MMDERTPKFIFVLAEHRRARLFAEEHGFGFANHRIRDRPTVIDVNLRPEVMAGIERGSSAYAILGVFPREQEEQFILEANLREFWEWRGNDAR